MTLIKSKGTFLEIIKIAKETGRWFKPEHIDYWLTFNDEDNIVSVNTNNIVCMDYEDYQKQWELKMNEEWWEGDFKKKYPLGVICNVNASQDYNANVRLVIINDVIYDTNGDILFVDTNGNKWSKVYPIDEIQIPKVYLKINDQEKIFNLRKD